MGTLRLPRGTAATLNNRTGQSGEIAYDTSNDRARVYNGTSGGSSLAYQSDFEPGSWTAANLQNSWVNFGSGHQTARYRKSASGTVFIEGLIQDGDINPGTVIFNLPSGMRPSNELRIVTVDASQPVGIGVQPNGNVTCESVSTNGWLSITISFSASQ